VRDRGEERRGDLGCIFFLVRVIIRSTNDTYNLDHALHNRSTTNTTHARKSAGHYCVNRRKPKLRINSHQDEPLSLSLSVSRDMVASSMKIKTKNLNEP
jgi:hypothetical protein